MTEVRCMCGHADHGLHRLYRCACGANVEGSRHARAAVTRGAK